ncbi:MAG: type II/IV secretion system protein [Paludibacteraceae bacterium]|nr:type II/IV secretion system protein [Paludibacteraceae bacterium]
MSETLDYILLDAELQQLITANQAWQYAIIPKEYFEDKVTFYIDKNKNLNTATEELEFILGKKVKFEQIETNIIQKTLSKFYRKIDKKRSKVSVTVQDISQNYLEEIISEADAIGCSDIHFEVYEEKCRIRFRIDGKLIERYILKKSEYPVIINKIKIKANLDIAEKRLPQDGRIFFILGEQKFDIRISVVPTLYGEKVVMRILSNDITNVDLKALGFTVKQLEDYLEAIKKPNGIILISGPTGSGKTTTLYGTLKLLNTEDTNILTIEDPIEYTLEGVNQVQLKEDIGLDFTKALRTFLRQDPDIIMLGEIRDGETAQMAIRAALTGHMVLSTIHTNSAWGTVSRLIDMNVPAFLLASTISLTVAQRLVRKLCPACKEEASFNKDLLPKGYSHKDIPSKHFIAKGCEKCYYTGYKGRKAVYEVIPIDAKLANNIKNGNLQINEILKEKQIKSLSEAAFEAFEKGETTIDEIYPILISTDY